jgi:hypothetical protein
MWKFISKAKAMRDHGMSYLSSVSATFKHMKSLKYGELTLSLYLAPAKMSGYEVCPGRNAECTRLCLNQSGKNIGPQKIAGDYINRSRITKTKMFFEHRDFFMDWLIRDIEAAQRKAERMTYKLSVRLNNTSDISPEEFTRNGKNILEIFPDIQFYEYTKVPSRVKLMDKYPNYDVTFSYTGYNLTECQEMLLNKVRVAVVFKNVPEVWEGYPVIDGDAYDMRYKDDKEVIVGLKYKTVRNKLSSQVKFVVQ